MEAREPALWMTIPFVALVAMIAAGPPLFSRWWGRNYAKTSCLLAVLTVGLYLAADDGALVSRASRVSLRTLATLREYFSFLALVGSLFVVSGGIHLRTRKQATPGGNVLFLLIGAVLANLFGTTGASMLLIRPWLKMNRGRSAPHQAAFFIFIVSNVGGGLTPIGDPPLLVGWLRGVPFWWVAVHGWAVWLVALSILLAMFFVLDCRSSSRAKAKAAAAEAAGRRDDATRVERRADTVVRPALQAVGNGGASARLEGWPNLIWAAVILAAVFCPRPPFLREGIMLAAAALSYLTTRREIHSANEFGFAPLAEVAFLFLGIFVTMMPALDWIEIHARTLGAPGPALYYWGSGALSSGLDSVPAYLAFLQPCLSSVADPGLVARVQSLLASGAIDLSRLSGAQTPEVRHTLEAIQTWFPSELARGGVTLDHVRMAVLLGNAALHRYLLAMSFGSVLFGANTYIGNAPNFMVKVIAEQHGSAVPGFLGYITKFALPFMLPTLIVVWWAFFRG
jgi:Na+/H+ antiporter NhaD/arsenite permease-like protein